MIGEAPIFSSKNETNQNKQPHTSLINVISCYSKHESSKFMSDVLAAMDFYES